ncbi:MAG: hypothetical protein JXR97_03470 [Planctomycetes bacterium]|nr:hypothetical protein [Planctomycetota bacterium]
MTVNTVNSAAPEIDGKRANARFPWFPLGVFGLFLCLGAFYLFAPGWLGKKPEVMIWTGHTVWNNCHVIARVSSDSGESEVVDAELFFRNGIGNPEFSVDLSECRLFTFNGAGIAPGRELEAKAARVDIPADDKMNRVVVPFERGAVLPAIDRLYGIRFKINGETFNLLGRVFRSADEAEEYIEKLLNRADFEVPFKDGQHDTGSKEEPQTP